MHSIIWRYDNMTENYVTSITIAWAIYPTHAIFTIFGRSIKRISSNL